MFIVRAVDSCEHFVQSRLYDTYAEAHDFLKEMVIDYGYDPEDLEIIKIDRDK